APSASTCGTRRAGSPECRTSPPLFAEPPPRTDTTSVVTSTGGTPSFPAGRAGLELLRTSSGRPRPRRTPPTSLVYPNAEGNPLLALENRKGGRPARLGLESLEGRIVLSSTLPAPVPAPTTVSHTAATQMQIQSLPPQTQATYAHFGYHWGTGPAG